MISQRKWAKYDTEDKGGFRESERGRDKKERTTEQGELEHK
jgi:hypothetical protein